jgi:hypothetical protein
MSGPLFSYHHPFEAARHPTFEPEVKRAILASLASDAAAIPARPRLRKPADLDRTIRVAKRFDALRVVDRQQEASGSGR